MALYLCKDSPKLKYLAKLMGEICLDEKNARRAIIFSDGPMPLWNIEGFLSVRAQTIVSPPPLAGCTDRVGCGVESGLYRGLVAQQPGRFGAQAAD